MMKHLNTLLISGLLLFTQMTYAQSNHSRIKQQLKTISVLVGDWDVTSEFTTRDGEVRKEVGTYRISWQLDSTYLLWEGKFTNADSGGDRGFSCWLTFDTKEESYRQLYLYSRSSLQIVETGTFEESSKNFITNTVINHPDGVVELLRNEMKLDNKDKLIYESFATFDEDKEVKNFVAIMSRKE